MGRKAPLKCQKCAALTMDQVHALHGTEGNGEKCWDAKHCPNRRSYLRHSDRINQQRSRSRQEAALETLDIEVDKPFATLVFAVMVVYRDLGAEAPIHAIAGQVWQGKTQILAINPIHCVGMVPAQVHEYIQKMLHALGDRYGIKKFASLERLDPDHCPIEPCPKRPTWT